MKTVALLAAALVAACGTAASRDVAARRIVSAELADSVAIPDDLADTIWLHRVVVRTARGADTLPGVLTMQRPVVVGDSVVYGLLYEHLDAVAAFANRGGARGVERLEWPEKPLSGSTPIFAPGGRFVAYAAADSAGAHPLVLAWPEARVVLRGPSVSVLATDVGADAVTWRDSTHVEVQIDLGLQEGQPMRTLRYRGDATRGVGTSDTIARPASGGS